MSTFYFSGIEKAATAKVLGEMQATGMMSRLQYSDDLMQVCNDLNLVLVMDSGAFTRPLTRAEIRAYALLIIKLGARCLWYANADVRGDQVQSHANYQHLLSLLPEELHSRVLYIYQYGADLRYLYEACAQYQRIGIGGLVPLLQSQDSAKAFQVIVQLAHIIANYPAVPHFFGLSTVSIIHALHDILPDFSVDSTTWLAGSRFGRLINNRGKQQSASELGYDFDQEAILKQNVRTMRKWVEGPTQAKKAVAMLQMSLDLSNAQEGIIHEIVRDSA